MRLLHIPFGFVLISAAIASPALANTSWPDPFDYSVTNIKKWMPHATPHRQIGGNIKQTCKKQYWRTWVSGQRSRTTGHFRSLAAALACTKRGGTVRVMRQAQPLAPNLLIRKDVTIIGDNTANRATQKATLVCAGQTPCISVDAGAAVRIENLDVRQTSAGVSALLFIRDGHIHLEDNLLRQNANFPNVEFWTGTLTTYDNEFIGGAPVIFVPRIGRRRNAQLTMEGDDIHNGIDGIVVIGNADIDLNFMKIHHQKRHGVVVGANTFSAQDSELLSNGTNGAGFGIVMKLQTDLELTGNHFHGNRAGGLAFEEPLGAHLLIDNDIKCSPVGISYLGKGVKRFPGFKTKYVPWSFVREKKRRFRKTCRTYH